MGDEVSENRECALRRWVDLLRRGVSLQNSAKFCRWLTVAVGGVYIHGIVHANDIIFKFNALD